MNSSKKELLLVQIGPVQEFIIAARTVEDLWSGSYFIAHLTAAGINYVAKQDGCRIIFPCLENQQVYLRFDNPEMELGQPTLPNRFCAEVPAVKAAEIALGAEDAIRAELKKISNVCFKRFLQIFQQSGKRYQERWQNQVERFLQLSYQTISLDENNWGESYGSLLANLAARRNTRNFMQIAADNESTGAYKDALNGKDEIVGDKKEWDEVLEKSDSLFKKRDDRPYGAINFIKRVWKDCYLKAGKQKQKSAWDLIQDSNGEAENYIAAIQMDGDKMGAILSAKHHNPEFFTRFSKKLANFTRERAGKIIENHKGVLVYGGGDDVLALLPACEAIPCTIELQNAFCEDNPDMPGSEKNLADEVAKVTLSAGISFCHWKTPLSWLLNGARAAEHRAKELYDRDALAINIYKRSGEILLWGAKFDSPGWELFHQFADLDRAETISGRFASALAMYLKKYQLEKVDNKNIFKQIIVADFAHVCKNQSNKDIPEKFKDLAEFYLDELENNSKLSLAEFTQLFLSATFLIRKGDDK